MKKILLLLMITSLSVLANAQFTKATLQATGLTCAMCNNAIHKALLKLPYIASVKSDIKNSSFLIEFKENADADIDGLKEAVEDAGFSIGQLKMTGRFEELKIGKDQHLVIGKQVFHFMTNADQVLNGEQTIQVVDKGFLTAKQFKKISSATAPACLHTGVAADCCVKDGVPANARVFHVTI